MSKKKRYFLNENLTTTDIDKSNQQQQADQSSKQNSSRPICIGELEDRCLIKMPKKKLFDNDIKIKNDKKTALVSLVEAFKKKKLSKCKVISVFGKKCPPPPGLKLSPEEKNPKSIINTIGNSIESKKKDLIDKVDFEIERLASLLKESVDSTAKKTVKIDTPPPPVIQRSATNKKQDQKRSNKKISNQQTVAKPINNNLSNQIDAEIEKLVEILNDSKEKVINKLSKLSSKKSAEKTDLKSKTRSIKTGLIPNQMESIFPNQLNKEIDKINTVLKEPPSILKRKKSAKKSNDHLKQEKDLIVSLRDKTTLLKLKKIDNSREKSKKNDSNPSNLLKEIKLFKQEKENNKQSFVTRLRSQLKEKLEKEKANLTLDTTTTTNTSNQDSCPVIIKKKDENKKVTTLLKEKRSKLVKLLASHKKEEEIKPSNETKKEESTLKNELTIKNDKPSIEGSSKLIDTTESKIISDENSSILSDTVEPEVKKQKMCLKKPNLNSETSSTKIIISKEPKKINDSFKKVSEARNKILAILSKQIQSSLLYSTDNDLPAPKVEPEVSYCNSPTLMIEDTERSETPDEILIRPKIVHLGVVETNPDDYMKQFGNSVIESSSLPQYILDIKPPEGITLAADNPTQTRAYELEGDVDALKLIDSDVLEREGLGDYKTK
jgi:hypothetical protein